MSWLEKATAAVEAAYVDDRTHHGYTNRGVEDARRDAELAIRTLRRLGLAPVRERYIQNHEQAFVADGLPHPSGVSFIPHRWCLEFPGNCACPVVQVVYETFGVGVG